MMGEAPFDVPRAHRWFAVEFNNLAWDLVAAESRTPDEVERMLHAAHAACFHWLQVGTLLNHLRAQCLLATAYAVAGLAESAVRYADRCLALSEQAGDEQTLFDRATTHGCAAKAYALAGRTEEADTHHRRATETASQFDDPDDKRVFESLYGAAE